MLLKPFTLHLSLLATALLIAGCAGTSGEPSGNDAPAAATAPPPVEVAPAPAEAPPPAPVAQQPRLPDDGIVAEFNPKEVALTPETIALLERLVETREADERLEITGYCHRKDAPVDARDIALMRAMAVRKELLRLGVPVKTIRVKYQTVQALHAVKIAVK
ncbi:OmpA family protein [Paracidovorax sp. MALMAid1276]|uniref:OmpA family protein n=1 Tax=Paracidovorax sp. MALMAid1276 TaxID=3411631 RepID=UPI003B99FD69